jgi:cell division transport system permease protein
MKNIFTKGGNLSSISSVISLSLVLFVIGILSLVLINAKQYTDKIKEEGILFSILLNDANDKNHREKFKSYLDSSGYFLDIKFIDKETAYEEVQKEMGEDFSSVLDINPLPDSYDAHIKAEYIDTNGLKKIENFIEHYKGEDIVQNFFYQKTILEKIDSKTSKASLFLLPFCVVFLLISFALINNAIRLSIYSKRLSIRTMRLVGATNMFIQKPYLISSVYQGFFSSVIAIFMLIGSIEMLKEIFPKFLQPNDFIEIAVIFGLILIFGIIISWISTFFAVRRYLNLNENELFN